MSVNHMPFLECVEKTAHNKLAHSRVRCGVEWFSAKHGADHVKQAVIESALEVRQRALAEGEWKLEWDIKRFPETPVEIYEWEGKGLNKSKPRLLISELHRQQSQEQDKRVERQA